jgi:signal transduction histidine kinase
VLPIALVALVTTSAAALVGVLVVSGVFESRIETQILNTSNVIAGGGFALNPAILRSVKAITGADVVTFDAAGQVLASTLDPSRAPLRVAIVRSDAAQRAFAASAAAITREPACDPSCYVAYRRVDGRADTVVAVIAETSDVSAATAAITRPIVLAALTSLVTMVLVSQFVARRITRPLEKLVAFTRDVSAGAAPGRAPAGDDEIGRLGGAFNDMLDRLNQSQAALVRSEKLGLAGLLAARVAHDIRNPLASMKIQTQLLQSRVRGNADSSAMVAAVLRDIVQVESVIRDLIELARPGELKRQRTDLNDVVRDVIAQLEPQLTHRKIGVDLSLTDQEASVPLDAGRFRQALVNIVVNAADAMPNGGYLNLDTQLTDGGSRLVLDVCDDGVGIDPAMAERVFDPFVSSKPGGVGLGLVNAKSVVESHGGTIALMPRPIRGTRVRIILPVEPWPTS